MIIKQTRDFIMQETSKIIIGQNKVIEELILCYLAGGHVILESVPGLAKTLLAKTFAHVTGITFSRIQFTPDLMPSDILGNSIYNLKNQQFEFKKGPVFTNILLADEINRASPKTQSALLEIMQERQVTADGIKFSLEKPYMVIATQNPIEFEGTYPLPEAQLDRFLMKIILSYPAKSDEKNILKMVRDGFDSEDIDSFHFEKLPETWFNECREEAKKITVDDSIINFISDIVEETRNNSQIVLGVSIRAATGILKLARFSAALDDRDFVIPDDVKKFIKPVLRHRIILDSEAEIDGLNTDAVIEKIINKVKVPR
ncbi:MAG: magnesium chelatase [Spirochaetes bacterium GWF1_31_7]|nr:MAG: magnesium chelatase [Spirochaetes bacterium GWE1_32_154]OHD50044.1 MAG: magnesium chelatase [Spirochaetes bacterium GWE2_31_10]OHD52358.1 MAG: magnesium chelatase [Spirochaetes bacterium GWF1_31_7]OHD83158.1 MAG: magnesium chelatase [Spirochaetes bacterium RIFOXYB1_FULL_32_8]HBD95998.1 magnesium chelatase [Spirochaetia bacterium]